MRFYVKKRRAPSIIIVSLIDILAILLIFFIVTTTFKKDAENKQMMINLPDSKTAEKAPAEKQLPLVLAIKSEEEITLDGKPVKMEELAVSLARLREATPDRGIAMQADRDAPFGVVVKAMDALKEAGVKNIPTFTQPETGK